MRSAAFFAVTAAWAAAGATLAAFGFVGWSGSGLYLAWVEHGWSDGSGLPWAVLEVISVPDGGTVYRDEFFPDEDDFTCAVDDGPGEFDPGAALVEGARPLLDSLGIVTGNGGDLLVCHPLTDSGADPDRASFYGWTAGVDYHGPEYRLVLTETLSGEEQVPDWFPPPVLLRLILERVGGGEVELASDTAPVRGYTNVYDYRIREVRTHSGRYVAVVLDTAVPGFEGADGAFRVVTGLLP